MVLESDGIQFEKIYNFSFLPKWVQDATGNIEFRVMFDEKTYSFNITRISYTHLQKQQWLAMTCIFQVILSRSIFWESSYIDEDRWHGSDRCFMLLGRERKVSLLFYTVKNLHLHLMMIQQHLLHNIE